MAFELFDDILKPLPVVAKPEPVAIIRDTPPRTPTPQTSGRGNSALEELVRIEDRRVQLAQEDLVEAESDQQIREAFAERQRVEDEAAQAEGSKLRATSVAAISKFEEVSRENPFVRGIKAIFGGGDESLSGAQNLVNTAQAQIAQHQAGEVSRRNFDAESLDRLDAIDDAQDATAAAKLAALNARTAARVDQLGVSDSIARRNQFQLDNVTTQAALDDRARRQLLVGLGTTGLQSELTKMEGAGKRFGDVNGIKLGVGEIKNQIQANLTRDANIEALLLARQNNASKAAQVFEDNTISNLSRDETIEVIANQGLITIPTPRGEEQRFAQLPQEKLTKSLIAKTEGENAATDIRTGEQRAIAGIQEKHRDFVDQNTGVIRRSGIAFGENNVPRRLKRILTEGNQMVATALQGGTRDENGNVSFTRSQTTGFDRSLDAEGKKRDAGTVAAANRFFPEGSDGAKALTAFLDEDPISAEISFNALSPMILTGMPPGLNIDAPMAEGFRQARAVIAEIANDNLTNQGSNGIELDDPDFASRILEAMVDSSTGKNALDEPGNKIQISSALYQGYAQEIFGGVFSTMIQGARNNPIQVDTGEVDEQGNPISAAQIHASGGLDESIWQSILISSNNAGVALTQGSDESVTDFATRRAREENTSLIRSLEIIPLTPAQRATHEEQGFLTFADSVIDWMGTDQFDDILGRVNEEQREASFPSALAQNGINVGARLEQDLRDNVTGLIQIKEAVRSKLLDDRLNRARLYGGTEVRARTIIGAIADSEGIDPGAVDRLLEAVEARIQAQEGRAQGDVARTQRITDPKDIALRVGTRANVTTDSIILQDRFEDPEVENTRRLVAKSFELQAKFMDLGMARLDARRRDDERGKQ